VKCDRPVNAAFRDSKLGERMMKRIFAQSAGRQRLGRSSSKPKSSTTLPPCTGAFASSLHPRAGLAAPTTALWIPASAIATGWGSAASPVAPATKRDLPFSIFTFQMARDLRNPPDALFPLLSPPRAEDTHPYYGSLSARKIYGSKVLWLHPINPGTYPTASRNTR